MKGRILTLDSAEKPWCLENPKFSGDQITLPTSQKRVYGLFKASFFDCTIKFFAAFEKVRVFQQNQQATHNFSMCGVFRRDLYQPNLRELLLVNGVTPIKHCKSTTFGGSKCL